MIGSFPSVRHLNWAFIFGLPLYNLFIACSHVHAPTVLTSKATVHCWVDYFNVIQKKIILHYKVYFVQFLSYVCVYVCVCAYVRACVRACLRTCIVVCACVRMYMWDRCSFLGLKNTSLSFLGLKKYLSFVTSHMGAVSKSIVKYCTQLAMAKS